MKEIAVYSWNSFGSIENIFNVNGNPPDVTVERLIRTYHWN